eukprot:6214103-Pleurochrysis_carterae.AAC.2
MGSRACASGIKSAATHRIDEIRVSRGRAVQREPRREHGDKHRPPAAEGADSHVDHDGDRLRQLCEAIGPVVRAREAEQQRGERGHLLRVYHVVVELRLAYAHHPHAVVALHLLLVGHDHLGGTTALPKALRPGRVRSLRFSFVDTPTFVERNRAMYLGQALGTSDHGYL